MRTSEQSLVLNVHHDNTLLGQPATDEQILAVERQRQFIDFERADIGQYERALFLVHEIKTNVRVLAVVREHNKPTLRTGRECLVAAAMRVELDLGLTRFQVQSIKHVVGAVPDRVHEDQIEISLREQERAAMHKASFY